MSCQTQFQDELKWQALRVVVVAAAVTWCWWLSVTVIHSCCCCVSVHCCYHGGGNNTYKTNVSYKKLKLKEFEKKNLPSTAQEMLLTSLGPKIFFSYPLCPSELFVPTAHCLSSLPVVWPLTACHLSLCTMLVVWR